MWQCSRLNTSKFQHGIGTLCLTSEYQQMILPHCFHIHFCMHRSTWHEVDTQEIFVEIFKLFSMAVFHKDVVKLDPLQKLPGRTKGALKHDKAPRRYNLWDEAETRIMLKITTALKSRSQIHEVESCCSLRSGSS